MEIVMSCGNGIRSRGRTELELSCRKPFDNHHRTGAFGASPKIAGTGRGDLLLGMWCSTEQLKTKRQSVGTFAVGEEAEVSNAHETFREQMQQEAAQELIERKRQRLLFVVVGGIAPTKGDHPVRERD